MLTFEEILAAHKSICKRNTCYFEDCPLHLSRGDKRDCLARFVYDVLTGNKSLSTGESAEKSYDTFAERMTVDIGACIRKYSGSARKVLQIIFEDGRQTVVYEDVKIKNGLIKGDLPFFGDIMTAHESICSANRCEGESVHSSSCPLDEPAGYCHASFVYDVLTGKKDLKGNTIATKEEAKHE